MSKKATISARWKIGEDGYHRRMVLVDKNGRVVGETCSSSMEPQSTWSANIEPMSGKPGKHLGNYINEIDAMAALELALSLLVRCENPAFKSAFSDRVRGFLEWSWDYALAESFEDESVKGLARSISCGIRQGELADDEELVLDFLEARIGDLDNLMLISEEWDPSKDASRIEPLTWEMLVAELRTFPEFEKIKQEVVESRLAKLH